MVNAFREHPGQTTRVSELTGIKRARVVRAWHHGYELQGRPPISELLDADKVLARAKRADIVLPGATVVVEDEPGDLAAEVVNTIEPDDVVHTRQHRKMMAGMVERDRIRRKALEDSARTRAEEGALIAVSRRNVMALGTISAQVLRGAQQLATRMQKQLEKAGKDELSLKEGMQLIQRASVVVRLGTEAGKMAVQMERLAMGQPIGEGLDTNTTKLSPDDAERWIDMTVRALERARRRRESGGENEVPSRSAQAERPTERPSEQPAAPEPPHRLEPDAGLARSVGRTTPELN